MDTETMRYGVVDLGSNTMRMSVYEERGGRLRHMMSERELVGLIGYTSHGVLSDEGILRVVETLSEFRDTAQSIGCDRFACFATAGLRNIHNTEHAVELIRRRTGVEVRVISGEEEARLDFIGARRGAGVEKGLMVDMGGGSTELVRFEGGEILHSVSLPFGSLLLYKNFVREILPTEGELERIAAFVSAQLSGLSWLRGGEVLCVIGGTGRAVARLRQDRFDRGFSELQGYRFPASDLKALLRELSGARRKSARILTRITPERVHTVLPGLCAFTRLCKASGAGTVVVSRNGVREGFLHEHVLGPEQRQEEIS